MIISRTPFRMSFFGGGTDYPTWFEKNKGAVLATTIDKYCYITARYLPPFFEHKSRIIYSKMEQVKKIDEIDHPAVREVLRFLKVKKGVEIHHDGDLPARTGLGSSSSFTVGLLNALYALQGKMTSKEQLAREAIYIEQEMCLENVGCQDQTLAAYGGLNFVEFGGNNHLQIKTVTIPQERIKRLNDHLLLYYTGLSRTASEIAKHQIKSMPDNTQAYHEMYDMTLEAVNLLQTDKLHAFGKLLHKTWKIKKKLSQKISLPHIEQIFDVSLANGALGGKLLGAGGGGFVLLFVPEESQAKVREKLKHLLLVPFKFEQLGSQIIFYQPNSGEIDN